MSRTVLSWKSMDLVGSVFFVQWYTSGWFVQCHVPETVVCRVIAKPSQCGMVCPSLCPKIQPHVFTKLETRFPILFEGS